MSFCEVYYIHEEFDDVIVFPPLFYIPKNKERELLEILKKKSMEDDIKYEMLENKYSKEIERLEHYGLIVRELDRSTGKFSRINITNRGILYLELTKEEGYV
ncbi:MAG: hypothetical protein H0Z29_08860, partial [Candidatus Marinimicrobia bacterium]|nr:hypothetical protein [Candidatus Neomarinimicrobiota bacterium]